MFRRRPTRGRVQTPPDAFKAPLTDQPREGDTRQRPFIQVARPDQTVVGREGQYSLMVGVHGVMMFRFAGICQY